MQTADGLYRELIEPIEERMMWTVARIVRDPDMAADAFQNALESVWKHLKIIHQHPNPHGYILRICMTASYDILREEGRQGKREVALDPEARAAKSAPLPVEEKEREREILAAITALPRRQAEAVLMRVINDESYESIASALGCAEATARSHVSKGLACVREALSALDLE